jgi:hypothetical protein
MHIIGFQKSDVFIKNCNCNLNLIDKIHATIAIYMYSHEFLNSEIEINTNLQSSKEFLYYINEIIKKLCFFYNQKYDENKILIDIESYLNSLHSFDNNLINLRLLVLKIIKDYKNTISQNLKKFSNIFDNKNLLINKFMKIFEKESGYAKGFICFKRISNNKINENFNFLKKYLTPWMFKEIKDDGHNEYYIYKFLKIFFQGKNFFPELKFYNKKSYFIKYFIDYKNFSDYFIFSKNDKNIIDIDLRDQKKIINFIEILIFNNFIFGNSDQKMSNMLFLLNKKNKIIDLKFIDFENFFIQKFIKKNLLILHEENKNLKKTLYKSLEYIVPHNTIYNFINQPKMFDKKFEQYFLYYNFNLIIKFNKNLFQDKYFFDNSFEKIWNNIKNLELKIKIHSKTSVMFKKNITVKEFFDLQFIIVNYIAKEKLNLNFKNKIDEYKFILKNINSNFFQQDIHIMDFIKNKVKSKLSTYIVLSLYLKYCFEKNLNYKHYLNLEEFFIEKNHFSQIEKNILLQIKNNKNYKEIFLKELIEFRELFLKINFIKILKYKMIARSIIYPFSESDLMNLVFDIKNRIFNLNKNQEKQINNLKNKFPEESKMLNIEKIQKNYFDFAKNLDL